MLLLLVVGSVAVGRCMPLVFVTGFAGYGGLLGFH